MRHIKKLIARPGGAQALRAMIVFIAYSALADKK